MRQLSRFWKILLYFAVALWIFLIFYTSLFQALHPLLQGGLAVILSSIIVYFSYPVSSKLLKKGENSVFIRLLISGSKTHPSLLDLTLLMFSLIPSLYVLLNWETLVINPGVFETKHLIMGALLVFSLLEATRRSVGIIIPLLVVAFILYTLWGNFIPGRFGHPGFSLIDILYQLYLMTEGIWGMLTDLTSRIIAPFIIFGPVLFATGVGDTIMKLSTYVGGRIAGGSGHVAVISSSLFGMLSGSSVANAATTGAFTIPLMKKTGFTREFAGAVEASASSGGQIMPPIMGAGCFVMAEFLGIPYAKIMIAATIPALLYFIGISAGIWIEAKRRKIKGIPKELLPSLSEILDWRNILGFVLPIGTLLVLLFLFLPPQVCAVWALIVSISFFLLFGGGIREILARALKIWDSLVEGVVKTLAWLMIMMTSVQIVVSLISLTGFGVKISEFILDLSGYNLYLALFCAMLTSMILGMGMTTTAAYVVAAAVIAPALQKMGLDPLATHLFIFYFAIKSGLTPPVCITVFTTAAIAGANWFRTAMESIKLGIGGYIMPFFFVFFPAYLLKGSLWEISLAFTGATLAMFAIEASLLGYWSNKLNILIRVILLIAGLLLMIPKLLPLSIGFVLFIGSLLFLRILPSSKGPRALI